MRNNIVYGQALVPVRRPGMSETLKVEWAVSPPNFRTIRHLSEVNQHETRKTLNLYFDTMLFYKSRTNYFAAFLDESLTNDTMNYVPLPNMYLNYSLCLGTYYPPTLADFISKFWQTTFGYVDEHVIKKWVANKKYDWIASSDLKDFILHNLYNNYHIPMQGNPNNNAPYKSAIVSGNASAEAWLNSSSSPTHLFNRCNVNYQDNVSMVLEGIRKTREEVKNAQ